MQSPFSQPTLVKVLVLTAAGAVAFRLLRLGTRWRLRALPGPPALPILGNLPAVLRTPGGLTAYRDAMFKAYGYVYQMWLGNHAMVVVSHPDSMRKVAVVSNYRPALSRVIGGMGEGYAMTLKGLLFLSPETHGHKFRSIRKAFESALLGPANLAAHEPVIHINTARLVTQVSHAADSGQPIDMASVISNMTIGVIGYVAFGIDLHTNDPSVFQDTGAQIGQYEGGSKGWVDKPGTPEFGRGLTDAARLVFRHQDPASGSPWKIPAQFIPELEWPMRYLSMLFPDKQLKEELQARKDLITALRTLIKQWRDYKAAQEANDISVPPPAMSERGFLAKLLDAAELEGLSELDIIAQAYVLVLGGYETTASLLTAALHLLEQEPDKQALLQAEVDSVLQGKSPCAEDMERMPYLRAVVDEALRLYSPVSVVGRVIPHDMTLPDGKRIPGKTDVYLALRCAQRDPAIWPRATEFLPERWLPGHQDLAAKHPHAYTPFGLGSRLCPGYKLGLLEARLCLATLMQNFTFRPAPADLYPSPKWSSAITYCCDCLWSTVTRRKPEAALQPA